MFSKEKSLIEIFLREYLKKEQDLFVQHYWGKDVFNRLSKFIFQGKMIRGSLVLASYSLFNKNSLDDLLPISGAMELIHAGFLVQDDVMDKDKFRRKNPSIYVQYQEFLKDSSSEQGLHFGESMATCIGDVLFFLGYALMNQAQIPILQKQEIIALCSQEFISVGFAQMQDMFHGVSVSDISEDSILQVYRYKTGRYTFSLPFMIGAIAANQDISVKDSLRKIGEDLGTLFQLKDDEIGLFGVEEQIGKPVFSDVRENKKTLYWYYLFRYASNQDKEKLKNIFGNQYISELDIVWVRACINKYKVLEHIAGKQNMLKINIEKNIQDTPLPKEKKQMFFDLLKYTLERST